MNQPYRVILQFRQHPAHLSDINQDEQYEIQVVRAPGRGWGGPMQIAGLDKNQIRAIRTAYRGFVARQLASGDKAAGEWTLHPLRVIGSQLFRALPESVQQRLQQAQARAQERGRNLEVVLVFEPTARSLLDLPWELLHDPNTGLAPTSSAPSSATTQGYAWYTSMSAPATAMIPTIRPPAARRRRQEMWLRFCPAPGQRPLSSCRTG